MQERIGEVRCRCRAGCGDQPLPIPGGGRVKGDGLGFLEWGASDSACVPVWPGLQERKERMSVWVEVGAATTSTTAIHDDADCHYTSTLQTTYLLVVIQNYSICCW